MSRFNKEQCLALVERSPAAVGVHDKAAWLSIFATNAVVEDPVGSAPQRQGEGAKRPDALGRFYETFIAPNDIHFEVGWDVVCGNHVMRDLTIVIGMSESLTVRVPVHLLYELVDEGGELKIARLAAHWELQASSRQQAASGAGFMLAGLKSTLRMARHMGISGLIGFSKASSTVGEKGKERVYDFVTALANKDEAALSALVIGPGAAIELPRGRALSIADCATIGGNMRLDKVLAAGNVVTATLEYQATDAVHRGVLLCELDRATLKIRRVVGYWEE